MKAALEGGILGERFTDHDIRRETGSDTSLEHATKLLGHSNPSVTSKHYRVRPDVVKPLR
jgi:integrase